MSEELNKNQTANGSSTISLSIAVYVVLFLLGLWGCLAVYNASVYNTEHSSYFYAAKQLIWLTGGMACLYGFSKIPFSFYRDAAPLIAVAAFIPLFLVLLAGVRVNGMRGWFSFFGIYFQPAEFAKAPFILILSVMAARLKSGTFTEFLKLAGLTILWLIPIALEPDFGTGSVFVAGFITVYWLAGGRIKYLIYSALAALPAAIFVLYRHPYIMRRLTGFFDPGADPFGNGWHVRQFQYTMARGGFWGTSLGKAIWSNSYLPLSHSDSAFASLTEAVGFVGAFPVIVGFLAIAYIAYRLSLTAVSNDRRVFIFSMGIVFTVQAFIHISVNVTMMPPTGITLPMVSYGGSSLVSTLIAFGIILSAAKADGNENASS